jgi:hypothetical protein
VLEAAERFLHLDHLGEGTASNISQVSELHLEVPLNFPLRIFPLHPLSIQG